MPGKQAGRQIGAEAVARVATSACGDRDAMCGTRVGGRGSWGRRLGHAKHEAGEPRGRPDRQVGGQGGSPDQTRSLMRTPAR